MWRFHTKHVQQVDEGQCSLDSAETDFFFKPKMHLLKTRNSLFSRVNMSNSRKKELKTRQNLYWEKRNAVFCLLREGFSALQTLLHPSSRPYAAILKTDRQTHLQPVCWPLWPCIVLHGVNITGKLRYLVDKWETAKTKRFELRSQKIVKRSFVVGPIE